MKARFLLLKSKVLENYYKVKGIADIVSYSFKTNTEVGKILESETDSYFTVESLKSLRMLKRESSKRIFYYLQAASFDDLEEIFSIGVENFIVDNKFDLDTLLCFSKLKSVKINLFLRVKIKEKTMHTGKHFVFGMSAEQMNSIIPNLRKNENINSLGIHFHRKTQNVAEWSLINDVEEVLSKETLESVDFINIGGGLPSRYKNYELKHLESIFNRINEFREWANSRGIKLIIEPGRFIAASAVKLECEIIAIYENNIIVNCSVFNAAMDTFVLNLRLLVEGELEENQFNKGQFEERNAIPYVIKGCTNDSMDIFRYKVYLPEKKVGDKIVFLNAGAYNYATDFCGLEKLETRTVD
ncbi:MAG: decarboxylase [Candidatus Woesearchaeota archaeon]